MEYVAMLILALHIIALAPFILWVMYLVFYALFADMIEKRKVISESRSRWEKE